MASRAPIPWVTELAIVFISATFLVLIALVSPYQSAAFILLECASAVKNSSSFRQGSPQGLVETDAGYCCSRVSINFQCLRFNYPAGQFFTGFNPPGIGPVFRGSNGSVHNSFFKLYRCDKTVFKGQTDPDIALSILQVRLAEVNSVRMVEGPSFGFSCPFRFSITAGEGKTGGDD